MRLKPKKPECSFCGKSDVAKMLAGPVGVNICSECVLLCLDVLSEQGVALPDSAQQTLSAAAKDEEHEALRKAAKRIAENLANASIELQEAFGLLRKVGLAGSASVECYWCNGRFPEKDISDYAALCDWHPAVVASSRDASEGGHMNAVDLFAGGGGASMSGTPQRQLIETIRLSVSGSIYHSMVVTIVYNAREAEIRRQIRWLNVLEANR